MLEEKWADNGEVVIERQAKERSAKRNGKKKKETVQVITKDLIRNLM